MPTKTKKTNRPKGEPKRIDEGALGLRTEPRPAGTRTGTGMKGADTSDARRPTGRGLKSKENKSSSLSARSNA